MFCIATHYQTTPGELREVVRVFREQAVPQMSQQPGFKGVCVMTKSDGELMVINLWETQQQALTWPQSTEHKNTMELLRPYLIGASSRDGYEVQVHVTA